MNILSLKVISRFTLVAVLLFAIKLGLGLPEMRQLYGTYDKWVHVGVFFCIPFLFNWITKLPIWFLFSGPLLIGGIEEYLQKFEPSRACDINDWLAELLGVSLACGILCLWFYIRDRFFSK